MDKFKGCVQMVCNMLERDNTPVRLEAAEELKNEVCRISSEFDRIKEENKKLKAKAIESNLLNKTEG